MSTTTQRPTPETENNLFEITTRDMLGRPTGTKEYTHAEFSRKLERERDEVREALSGRTVSCSQCNEAAKQLEVMREAIMGAHEALNRYEVEDVELQAGEEMSISVNAVDQQSLRAALAKLHPFLP